MFSLVTRRFSFVWKATRICQVSSLQNFNPTSTFATMEKKKSISNLSASVSVSILGNGALGNPCSVVVNTDSDTFLINCGEGVQRLFYQHKYLH